MTPRKTIFFAWVHVRVFNLRLTLREYASERVLNANPTPYSLGGLDKINTPRLPRGIGRCKACDSTGDILYSTTARVSFPWHTSTWTSTPSSKPASLSHFPRKRIIGTLRLSRRQ